MVMAGIMRPQWAMLHRRSQQQHQTPVDIPECHKRRIRWHHCRCPCLVCQWDHQHHMGCQPYRAAVTIWAIRCHTVSHRMCCHHRSRMYPDMEPHIPVPLHIRPNHRHLVNRRASDGPSAAPALVIPPTPVYMIHIPARKRLNINQFLCQAKTDPFIRIYVSLM